MPIEQADNTLGTARDLILTPSTQTFTDFIGDLDTKDLYRFKLNSASSLNLSLGGLTNDANVALLNSVGRG